jgi:sec-independent protein translocase protein TatC
MADDTQTRGRLQDNARVMTFWELLEELRSRLFKALLAVVAGLLIAYFFVPQVQAVLIEEFFPGKGGEAPLAFLKPTEGFVVRLKLALVMGVILASPVVFYQFWRFVAPGLYPKEKHFIIPVVVTSTFSFLIGSAFSVFVLPYATRFFLSFAVGGIQNTWSFGSYVDFVVRLIIAFGVVFELPLVIYFLVRLGIVTPEFLRRQRRYAVIVFMVLAAVISPPDIFTMLVLAVPLMLLYEISIVIAVFARKRYQANSPN